MASTSETGHAKNLASFESLISFCTAYGVAYNPSKDALSIANLNGLYTDASNVLQKTKSNKTLFDNATNERALAFKELKPLATKIVNALAASGASNLVVDDAKSVNRKIQGARASKPEPTTLKDGEETPKTISTSQQSFDNMIDHLAKLVETVSQDANYKPNEADLKTAALNTKLTQLKALNTSLLNGYTAWSNARISRDAVLYDPITGLVQIAIEVKKYVKSVFGASSPQFKQVNVLDFKTIKY